MAIAAAAFLGLLLDFALGERAFAENELLISALTEVCYG
jgi:hypothetical protein